MADDGERSSWRAGAERRRPAWMNSPGWAVLMFAIAAYWGWFALAAVRRGVYWLAALDALLFTLGLVAGVRVLRRRRREGGRADG